MENNPQTLEDLLLSLARQWQMLVLAMLLLTLISVAACYLLLKSNRPLWAHRFMAIPVFLTTIPGMFYIMILVHCCPKQIEMSIGLIEKTVSY